MLASNLCLVRVSLKILRLFPFITIIFFILLVWVIYLGERVNRTIGIIIFILVTIIWLYFSIYSLIEKYSVEPHIRKKQAKLPIKMRIRFSYIRNGWNIIGKVVIRISNKGKETLQVQEIQLISIKSVSLRSPSFGGYISSSKPPYLDMEKLITAGEFLKFNISESIYPGESKKYELNLGMKTQRSTEQYNNYYWVHGWEIRPQLSTNYGKVLGKLFEIWLPDPEIKRKSVSEFVRGMKKELFPYSGSHHKYSELDENMLET